MRIAPSIPCSAAVQSLVARSCGCWSKRCAEKYFIHEKSWTFTDLFTFARANRSSRSFLKRYIYPACPSRHLAAPVYSVRADRIITRANARRIIENDLTAVQSPRARVDCCDKKEHALTQAHSIVFDFYRSSKNVVSLPTRMLQMRQCGPLRRGLLEQRALVLQLQATWYALFFGRKLAGTELLLAPTSI